LSPARSYTSQPPKPLFHVHATPTHGGSGAVGALVGDDVGDGLGAGVGVRVGAPSTGSQLPHSSHTSEAERPWLTPGAS